jgi:hypothetical protein
MHSGPPFADGKTERGAASAVKTFSRDQVVAVLVLALVAAAVILYRRLTYHF